MEIWKDVKDYEGLYQISNLGRVKCCERLVYIEHRGYKGFRKCKEKILKTTINNFGYEWVSLSKNHKYCTKFIHRLVAQAFIENTNNFKYVNHKDENKLNNKVENLEWCSAKYNNNYGSRNKRISNSRKGMKFTDEHRKNLSNAQKLRVNDEFREKMRNLHLGSKLSEQHKQNISNGVKRAYKQKLKRVI